MSRVWWWPGFGGEEGDREVEGPVQGEGPAGRREVQLGSAGLPGSHGRGQARAGVGGGHRQRGFRAGGAGMAGGARSGGDGAGRGRDSTVPTHARLHGVRRNGVGGVFLCLSFDCHARFSVLCNSLCALYIFVGQAWAEGKRGACNEPPARGQRTGNGLYIPSP